MSVMTKTNFFDRALGWAVAGIFVVGGYAVAHFMLNISDSTIVAFTVWMLWADLAKYINKADAP